MRLALLLAIGGGGVGCSLTQRASTKVVDPALAAEGTAYSRERAPGGYQLGPYRVRDIGVRGEAPDPDGPLASDDVRRPVTQHRAGLVLDAADGRSWTTACTLQRRASNSADYRAVLDENGDEIAVDCIAKAPGLPPWQFSAHALLSKNFVGMLRAEAGGAEAEVEVLTRVTHFRRLERLLPVPVVQVKDGDAAVLAVLIGRPEKAWVKPDAEAQLVEAGLAVALTLGVLPWEVAE